MAPFLAGLFCLLLQSCVTGPGSTLGEATLSGFLRATLMMLLGYGTYKLIAPKGRATTPTELGRTWVGAAAGFFIAGTFRRIAVGTVDLQEGLLSCILILLFCGPVAFALGWGYGYWFRKAPRESVNTEALIKSAENDLPRAEPLPFDGWPKDTMHPASVLPNSEMSRNPFTESAATEQTIKNYEEELTDTQGSTESSSTGTEGYHNRFYEQYPNLELAETYYPDLRSIVDELASISFNLANSFVETLLRTKEFDNRRDLAERLANEFFKNFFGSDPYIGSFAKTLLSNQLKNAAFDLNQAVMLFGPKINSIIVVEKICKKYGLDSGDLHTKLALQDAKRSYTSTKELLTGVCNWKDVLRISQPMRYYLGVVAEYEPPREAFGNSIPILMKVQGKVWELDAQTELATWIKKVVFPMAENAGL